MQARDRELLVLEERDRPRNPFFLELKSSGNLLEDHHPRPPDDRVEGILGVDNLVDILAVFLKGFAFGTGVFPKGNAASPSDGSRT